MPENHPIDWDDVIAVHFVADGSSPPTFHIRDQEARTAALPPCSVAPAHRGALTPVALAAYPATLWLPAPEAAEPLDVPPEVQAWEWPDGAQLHIMFTSTPELPGLHAVSGYPPETRRAELAGRPVAVTVAPPGAPEPDGSGATVGHRVQVDGYLDDYTHVWAEVDAPTAAGRDRLLAALLTLTPDPPHRPAGTPTAA